MADPMTILFLPKIFNEIRQTLGCRLHSEDSSEVPGIVQPGFTRSERLQTNLFHVDHAAAADRRRRSYSEVLNLEHHVQSCRELDSLGICQAKCLVVVQYLRHMPPDIQASGIGD